MKQYFRTNAIVCSLSLFFAFAASIAMAQAPQKIPLDGPMGFIENKGQFLDQEGSVRKDLLYMYIRDGLKVQLKSNGISFDLFTMEEDQASISEADGYATAHHLDPEDAPLPKAIYKSNRIDLEFIGANADVQVVAEEVLPDYLNYYLSYTPQEGITKVKQFNKVTYKGIYDNIDLVMIAAPVDYPVRSLAYDFIVHPGGNANDIRYRYHGVNGQEIYDNGTLESSNGIGRIFEMIPESYIQSSAGIKLMPVEVSFKKENDFITFNVPHYDNRQSLIIDPTLVWATYCGGLYSDEGRGLAVDSEDHVILTGRTYSTENIATDGAYQTQLIGDIDIMIEKYYDNGARIWGTYYGGSGLDRARACIVNEDEFIYLGAHTTSEDGIVTLGNGMHQEIFAGVEDGILAYFSPAGERVWATYYGGEDEDIIRRLKKDDAGNIIMVGYSNSDSGIATPDAWQPVNNGNSDLCLSKWTSGGQLIWATFLGGESEDHGRSVDADNENNIYVNGSTGSKFGIKKNAFRDHNGGGQDYLLAKYNPNGGLKWSTYWGGAVEDRGRGVRVDDKGKYVYYTGYSASDTGVATPGAFQENWTAGYDNQGQPYHDAVLMKWSTDGYPIWSTYLGDPPDDRGRAITMINNDVYMGGTTSSLTSMATAEGFQPVFGGKEDMFVDKFDSAGNRIWGTYCGGDENESTLALAADNEKVHIFMVGTAESVGISTPGVGQEIFGGFDDAFLLKIQVGVEVGVNETEPAAQHSMSIYPNPSQGNFVVNYQLKSDATLNVTDAKGTIVYAKTLNSNQHKLNISDLNLVPGLYEVVIANGNSRVATEKLIIIR
ncbi:MAG: T9SS type A sorting domain-containing protein [Chitinophagales bacterium]|nr:T9SS type A sorting domain-containing protein [Chitinophagales bacterium]